MNENKDLIPTRQSLLGRLKDWKDQESWKVFFDTYWRLIYHAALKAGLTDSEAQDVVQETVISVSKQMPEFKYDRTKSSFKTWLMRLTSWRIMDLKRKREPGLDTPKPLPRSATRTATVERVADPAGIEATWDEEWERNLLQTAVERVKLKVDSQDYQMFDLCVFKGWPVSRVAAILQINAAKVYVAKHRVGNLIKKEIAQLQNKLF